MSDTLYRSNVEVREHARVSALAGRPVFVNPHIGADAVLWFEGYRSVPDEQRGSQPDLRPRPHRVRMTRRKTSMSAAGVKALGHRTLKGSTPKPWAVDGGGW
jgi:hypothetical protein